MKKVLIDVNSTVDMFARGRHSGIARTTAELVYAINKIKDEFDDLKVELFSQNLKGIGCRNLQTRMKGHHLWLRNSGFMKQFSLKMRLRELMTNYDLIHIPHNYDVVPFPNKTIVTLHDALFMHIAESRFNHIGMRNSVPELIRECRHVITCSDYSKRDIIETMGVNEDKITVIPWGLKHEVFNTRIEKPVDVNFPYLMSVSCNAERKRTDRIVEAYLDTWKPGMKNHLLLVWKEMPEGLQSKINVHPARDYVHVESGVSDERLARLYRGATAMLFASKFEGFGLPLIEAMACGCPVVTASNSSLTEVGIEASWMLEEPIDKSLRNAISAIEDGSMEVNRYVDAGLKRSKLYQWNETARKTLKVYSALLKTTV